MRWVRVLAVVAALAAPAAGASAAAGGGVERVQAVCFAEYDPELGVWFGLIGTPDTPPFFPGSPTGGPFFTGGDGTAVFTPTGNMEASCHGKADLSVSPPFSGHGTCVAARGGEEFGVGSRIYFGEGEVVITPSGNVNLTCHGGFDHIG